MQRYFFFGVVVLTVVFFFSCKRKEKPFLNQVNKEIDLKGAHVNIKINRFDNFFTDLNQNNFPVKMKDAEKKEPEMYRFFIENITEAGRVSNPGFYMPRIKDFLLNPYTNDLYKDVQKKFPDMKGYESQLSEAFARVKYYFPKDTVPQFYTMVSNFAYGIVSFEHIIAISLDHFMGQDYKFYPDLYPKYMIRFFEPDYIVTDIMKTYFTDKFPEEAYSGKTMISQMIYHGKLLLFLDMVLPNIPDSIKVEYSQKQLDWVKENEGQFWNHLIDQQLLYQTNNEKIDRYFSEGPFTNAYGVPPECPPRIGQWTGWQIARNYIINNNDATFVSVLFEKDAQKILNLSRYKPKI